MLKGMETSSTVSSTRAMIRLVNFQRSPRPLRLSASIMTTFLAGGSCPRRTARISRFRRRPSCAREPRRRTEASSSTARNSITIPPTSVLVSTVR